MNKLQKEKRDRIILVCLGTGVLLVAVYFLLINREYNAIAQTKAKTVQAGNDLQDKIAKIKRQAAIESDLLEVSTNLSAAEQDIATGDPNAWFYETLRNFKGHYDVDISGYGSPSLGERGFAAAFSLQTTPDHGQRHGLLPRLGKFRRRS